MSIVLAFDPGPHTGVAVFKNGERVGCFTLTVERRKLDARVYRTVARLIDQYSTQIVNFSGYTSPIELGMLVPTSLRPTVVIERFHTASAAVGSQWSGVLTQMLCGFIAGYAELKYCNVVWQNSVDRKAFEAPAKAMAHGTDHEVSATAHGLRYLKLHLQTTAT